MKRRTRNRIKTAIRKIGITEIGTEPGHTVATPLFHLSFFINFACIGVLVAMCLNAGDAVTNTASLLIMAGWFADLAVFSITQGICTVPLIEGVDTERSREIMADQAARDAAHVQGEAV